MTITEIILVTVLLLSELITAMSSVKWTLMNSTIVFNDDVYLSCNVLNKSSQFLTETTKWKVNNSVALYEGYSLKASKYKQLELQNAFIMVIYNFTTDDINTSYSCSYGFSTFSKTLTMADVTTYELRPSQESTIATYNISEIDAKISLLFKEVYPLPVCESVSGNVSVSSLYQKKGIFLEVVVIFQQQFDITGNARDVQIKCEIGSFVYQNTFDANMFEKGGTYWLFIFIGISGTLNLVLGVFIISRKLVGAKASGHVLPSLIETLCCLSQSGNKEHRKREEAICFTKYRGRYKEESETLTHSSENKFQIKPKHGFWNSKTPKHDNIEITQTEATEVITTKHINTTEHEPHKNKS